MVPEMLVCRSSSCAVWLAYGACAEAMLPRMLAYESAASRLATLGIAARVSRYARHTTTLFM